MHTAAQSLHLIFVKSAPCVLFLLLIFRSLKRSRHPPRCDGFVRYFDVVSVSHSFNFLRGAFSVGKYDQITRDCLVTLISLTGLQILRIQVGMELFNE